MQSSSTRTKALAVAAVTTLAVLSYVVYAYFNTKQVAAAATAELRRKRRRTLDPSWRRPYAVLLKAVSLAPQP
jgi:uncharacterized membrane protein YebE (DUF533 family)